MIRMSLATLAAIAIAGCDGPREQAGEKADNAAGVVAGEDAIESGPAETMGERQDEARDSVEDAKEAQADALEEQADAARDAADERAEALDQQADRTRER